VVWREGWVGVSGVYLAVRNSLRCPHGAGASVICQQQATEQTQHRNKVREEQQVSSGRRIEEGAYRPVKRERESEERE
jgi:hypothetical protein